MANGSLHAVRKSVGVRCTSVLIVLLAVPRCHNWLDSLFTWPELTFMLSSLAVARTVW